MANNTITQQGRFIGTGNAVDIALRSDVDWMTVINATVTLAGGAGSAVRFEWFRGIGDGLGIVYNKLAADDSITQEITGAGEGFTLLDTSGAPDGAINATLTQINGAAPPIVSATSTAGLVAGDVVRFVNVPGAQQFGGIDFEIDTIVANTSFRLPYAPTIVTTGAVAGSFYPVNFDPIYYPRRRYISAITQANPAVITTTVSHGFTVGQKIRITGTADFDMTEIDGLTATITAVTASTITTDINSTAFTAFAWPLTADVPFTPAQVIPVGEAAEIVAGTITLDDATENQAEIIMRLAAGVNSPAGALNDIIYWIAGKSFDVDND